MRTARQDGDAARWVSVAIAPVAALPTRVTLATIKGTPGLAAMELLRQSRLSVSPVRAAEWAEIVAMAQA